MVFNSWVFVVFFVVIYLLYLRLDHKGQNRLLLVASCIFYGYFDYRFLFLVFVSAGLDYVCSHGISSTDRPLTRTALLVLALAGNLIILGFFKYYDFFIANVQSLCASFGYQIPLQPLQVLLPAGISFYTFQSMSYTIDVYRGQARACRDPLAFAVSVMFFPHLVAGPIQRAGNLIEQVRQERQLTPAGIRAGLWLMLKGYFLKVVVADNVGAIADRAFAQATPSGAVALLGIYAFAFQIYGDFAGYSSIARGLAKLMGFELMVNFQQPYLATNPSDFWRRWHISLSTWLRDYLYVPLGGNRAGALRTSRNLMLTMLLGGLWHGAAWKYVLWGGYQGLLLVGFRLLGRSRKELSHTWTWTAPLKVLAFFQLTCLGWLIFRCESLAQVIRFPWAILTHFGVTSADWHKFAILGLLVSPVLLLDLLEEYGAKQSDLLERLPARLRFAAVGGSQVLRLAGIVMLMVMLWTLGSRGGKPFIYFQF